MAVGTRDQGGSIVAGRIDIGCGQLTWPRDTCTPAEILAEIAQAGYDGAPASAPSLDRVDETKQLFAGAGLRPAPGYLGAPLWEPGEADAIVERAREMGAIAEALGLTELYVAANLTPERRAVAGHVRPQDSLDGAGYDVMAETLNRVGEATLVHGVRASFHNHVGSFIETRAEIDELFSRVDRSLVFHGPDIGHLAWAGDDVLAYTRDYIDAITTVHVKDIDPAVLAEGVRNGWDYRTFSDNGIFTELGQGFVDFPALADILRGAGFEGWLIVETDVTQRPTALESATISRDYLRSLAM
jgi:inosose dehydratase